MTVTARDVGEHEGSLPLISFPYPPRTILPCLRGPAQPSSDTHLSALCPAQQPERDGQGEQIPSDAIHESRAIRARRVENPPGYPAAERHANERAHHDEAYPHSRLLRRKMLADDDGVRRDDASLKEAEERRNDVQRQKRIEGQEEQQGHALKRSEERREGIEGRCRFAKYA